MTKEEFVRFVAAREETTIVDARAQVGNIIELLQEALEENGEVTLTGFGKFVLKTVPEGVRRIPSTGENMTVPEHRVPKFYFSTAVKNRMR